MPFIHDNLFLISRMSRSESDSGSLGTEKNGIEATVEQSHDEKLKEVYDFGGDTTLPPPPTLTPEQERRLWRKIDLWLMPILTLMYLCSFLDRGM